MIKILLSSLFLAVTSHATPAATCDSLFRGATHVQAVEQSVSATFQFPNALDARVISTASYIAESRGEKLGPQTAADGLFKDAFESALLSHSVVKPPQLLPMVLTRHGDGLYFERALDWKSLVGHTVVGYRTLAHDYLNMIPGVGWENVKIDRLYFAGVVMQADVVEHKLNIRLKTTSNAEITLKYGTSDTFEPFFVLLPKASPEAVLRAAFLRSSFEKVVGEAFGSPSVREDYDIATAIVETALAVPVTYGGSAVIKILLGRSIRGGESYPHYGLARGKKRYSEKNLKYFVGALQKFMEATEVVVLEAREAKDGSPDWLGNTNRTPIAAEFKKIWQELRAIKGGAETVVVEKKPRSVGSLKLSRDVAKPGTRITVKGTDLVIGDDLGQRTRLVATSGQVLEIVKAPRTIRSDGVSLSLIRLRDPKSGIEGETFWITAIKEAELKTE